MKEIPNLINICSQNTTFNKQQKEVLMLKILGKKHEQAVHTVIRILLLNCESVSPSAKIC